MKFQSDEQQIPGIAYILEAITLIIIRERTASNILSVTVSYFHLEKGRFLETETGFKSNQLTNLKGETQPFSKARNPKEFFS